MNKLTEIYQKHWEEKYEDFKFRNIPEQQSHIYMAMKEYAEYYAQKVISEIKKPENKIYHPEFGMRSYIIEDDFKLPDHE